MALQGAIAGSLPGKKLVTGTVAVTTTNAVDLSDVLQSIDSAVVSYDEVPAAGNENVSVAWSGTTMTISCWEADFTVGTVAKNVNYIAVGDAPR